MMEKNNYYNLEMKYSKRIENTKAYLSHLSIYIPNLLQMNTSV